MRGGCRLCLCGAGGDVARLRGIAEWGDDDAVAADGPGDEAGVGRELGFADAPGLRQGMEKRGDSGVVRDGGVGSLCEEWKRKQEG